MKHLFPSMHAGQWRAIAGVALLGALIAGGYGMLHDQVTYTLSPAYFTRVKFIQFAAADFGFPDRVWAAEVGFLSTWWVGLIAGWFMGRLVVPRWPAARVRRVVLGSFAGMLGCSLGGGILGAGVRPAWYGSEAAWARTAQMVGITPEELPDFIRVAHIHQGGYAGAVLGLGAVLLWLRRRGKSAAAASTNS